MAVWKKTFYNILYCAAVIAIVLIVWAVSAAIVDSDLVLPTVSDTFFALGSVLSSAEFWTGLGGTLLRCLISYAISVASAFILYFICMAYKPAGKILDPLISALRSLPAVAVTLILLIMVGGRGAPVVLGVIVIMPIVYSAARARSAAGLKNLEEVCTLYGTSKLQKLSTLWFPRLAGALPEILSSAFAYNVKTVIGGEILAQTAKSLGVLMKLSQSYLQTAMLIAFVVASVVIAVIAEIAIKYLLKFVLKKYKYNV